MGIIAEIVNEIAPADIEHRAQGKKGAEADVFTKAPIQDRGAKGAALTDERNAAGASHACGKGRIEQRVGTHHAETIGPNNPHRSAPGLCA